MPSIMELEDTVRGLPEQERRLFDDVFEVSTSTGTLAVPDAFKGKAWEYFAERDKSGRITETLESVLEKLKKQTVVRTFNKLTYEGAAFNALRANRPGMRSEDMAKERIEVDKRVDEARKGCDLCYPEQYTSHDTFGRIRSEHGHCITGANVAKFDAVHGMEYFREHHPLVFGEEQFHDYIETAFAWFVEAHRNNPDAVYPLLMWNCLEKAGASQTHGHTQLLLAKHRPYAKVAALRDASRRYQDSKSGNYFEVLMGIHDSLGLAIRNGSADVLVYITPTKDREVLMFAPYTDPKDANGREKLRESLYKTLRCFIEQIGVHCFDLAISMPPMENEDGWDHFPYVARIVDRGNMFKKTADIGSMELYGEPVIGTDPYKVMDALKSRFAAAE